MEEKDINDIAKAVTAAVGKLNADTKENNGTPETFSCPDCGSPVKANDPHCANCGCPLEWGE